MIGRRSGGRSSTVASTSTIAPPHPDALGLTNARTRIVGHRTGPLADSLVAVVRLLSRVGAAAAAFARRASGVVTAPGWILAVAVPAGFVLGYGLGWPELVTVAWACLVLLGIAALYLVGGSTLTIQLRMTSSRVVVGHSAVGDMTIVDPRRARRVAALIEIPVGADVVTVAVPGMTRSERFVHGFSVPTNRRGIVRVGPARSVRTDPLGLVRREHVWTEHTELYVHPRTIAIPSMSTGLVHDLEGNPTRDRSTSDMSFHALREYQPGDERRSIHWKSTAKTGRYMVRQFEETRRSHLLVALSLGSADYATADEVELAISAAGSLGVRAIRDARDVTVVVGAATPEFAKRRVFTTRSLSTLTGARLLDDLAGVEATPAALGVLDIARVSADRVAGVSVVFLVCGSAVAPARLRAASVTFPAGVEVVAIVCRPASVPGRIPGVRRVPGLMVVTIGSLEQLRTALARAAAV